MKIGRRQIISGYVLGFMAVIAALSVSTGTRVVATSHDDEERTTLQDLSSVDELITIFNAGKGSPRLLVLLSPT